MKLDKLKIDNISKTIASVKLKRFVKDLECNIGKKLLHDAIVMEGFVDIVNGDKVIHGKNSIVDQGLAAIINYLSAVSINTGLASMDWNGSPPNYNTYMVIGSGTSALTSNGTTTLQSPIGTAPGTKPSSQSGTNSSPAAGQWQTQWTATWNSGVVPAVTLGEVGLYLWIQPTLQTFGKANLSSPGSTLFSRMASADGKFTAFTINSAVPLSIAWTFRLTYTA